MWGKRLMLAGAVVLGLMLSLRGSQAQAPARQATFTAKTVNLSVGAGQPLKIDVFRWSTDAERTTLVNAWNDPKALAAAMQKAMSLGTIWTNESLGYTIRYASTETLPSGVERVVVITDGQLGAWSGQIWKPVHAPSDASYPFSLIELRLSRSGSGEGKMSLTGKVVAEGNALALGDWETAPVLLRPVKRETESQK